ncbi:hypothetical protein VTN31DRAFT_2670 [Thermomyces dupontii]|uniref:uncharacterized protein n=1 Tax=Talaromyces thermophilus TaxID=28565 RepID=UPI0037440B45
MGLIRVLFYVWGSHSQCAFRIGFFKGLSFFFLFVEQAAGWVLFGLIELSLRMIFRSSFFFFLLLAVNSNIQWRCASESSSPNRRWYFIFGMFCHTRFQSNWFKNMILESNTRPSLMAIQRHGANYNLCISYVRSRSISKSSMPQRDRCFVGPKDILPALPRPVLMPVCCLVFIQPTSLVQRDLLGFLEFTSDRVPSSRSSLIKGRNPHESDE